MLQYPRKQQEASRKLCPPKSAPSTLMRPVILRQVANQLASNANTDTVYQRGVIVLTFTHPHAHMHTHNLINPKKPRGRVLVSLVVAYRLD